MVVNLVGVENFREREIGIEREQEEEEKIIK